MENKVIKIDLGFAVLVVEKNPDPSFRELSVTLEDKNGNWLQDIAEIGQDYSISSSLDIIPKDQIRVLVYGDKNNEDYTDEFVIGLYNPEEE